jgi:hypothetical protein
MTRGQLRICSAYKNGMLIRHIIERFGTHRAGLYKLLREAYVTRRNRNTQRDERMRRERREGMSVARLVLKYGITGERVRQILRGQA